MIFGIRGKYSLAYELGRLSVAIANRFDNISYKVLIETPGDPALVADVMTSLFHLLGKSELHELRAHELVLQSCVRGFVLFEACNGVLP